MTNHEIYIHERHDRGYYQINGPRPDWVRLWKFTCSCGWSYPQDGTSYTVKAETGRKKAKEHQEESF